MPRPDITLAECQLMLKILHNLRDIQKELRGMQNEELKKTQSEVDYLENERRRYLDEYMIHQDPYTTVLALRIAKPRLQELTRALYGSSLNEEEKALSQLVTRLERIVDKKRGRLPICKYLHVT
jgi:hypothetical protein